MNIVQFAGHTWGLVSGKAYSVDGLEVSIATSQNTTEKDGQNGVNIAGVDPVTVNLQVNVSRGLGADPMSELNSLYGLLASKQGDRLYVLGSALLNTDFILTSLDMSEVQADAAGVNSATFDLEFMSYDAEAKAKETSTPSTGYASGKGKPKPDPKPDNKDPFNGKSAKEVLKELHAMRDSASTRFPISYVRQNK